MFLCCTVLYAIYCTDYIFVDLLYFRSLTVSWRNPLKSFHLTLRSLKKATSTGRSLKSITTATHIGYRTYGCQNGCQIVVIHQLAAWLIIRTQMLTAKRRSREKFPLVYNLDKVHKYCFGAPLHLRQERIVKAAISCLRKRNRGTYPTQPKCVIYVGPSGG